MTTLHDREKSQISRLNPLQTALFKDPVRTAL